jgi:hypothetical protein
MEVRQPVGGAVASDPELETMGTLLHALQQLDDEARQRVLDWLAAKLGLRAPSSPRQRSSASSSAGDPGDLGTIKAFVNHKSPEDDVTRATTLAYFLTHSKGQSTFKTTDLTAARIAAALASFNTSRAVSHAQRAGYITSAAGRGVYHITSTGEALVGAMPDRENMQAVKSQSKKRKRPATRKRATVKATIKKA